MYSNMTAAEVYRREAERLRTMADSATYTHVREGFLEMARTYDVMSAQADEITDHSFGQPFARHSAEPNSRYR